MGPLDLLRAPLRSMLGVTEDAEREVVSHSPVHETGELEHQLQEAVSSIHHVADSMEHHVEVVETLATTVPKLTDSVNALVQEMHALNSTLKPVVSAEHDVSRLGHLFGHRHGGRASTAQTETLAEPPADPGRT
jgi:prophage DNA circulation protein